MNSKSFLIALAAFAVTTTGAQAYVGTKQLQRAGLSPEQVSAFAEARTLAENGNTDKARDILLSAGVREDTIKRLAKAKGYSRGALKEALEAEDFVAFRAVVEGTPLYDLILTEADFADFLAAHRLWQVGETTAAREAFQALGLTGHGLKSETGQVFKRGNRVGMMHSRSPLWANLSAEEQAAYREALRANDKETAKAILEKAGVTYQRGKRLE